MAKFEIIYQKLIRGKIINNALFSICIHELIFSIKCIAVGHCRKLAPHRLWLNECKICKRELNTKEVVELFLVEPEV